MWDALPVLLLMLGIFMPVLAAACFRRADPAPLFGRDPIDTGPSQPCWTETIRREGGLILGRGECVNDMLMEMDKRASRRDFPIPIAYE
jgi:hypothetical protein